LVVLLATACACASERQGTTWSDDRIDGVSTNRRTDPPAPEQDQPSLYRQLQPVERGLDPNVKTKPPEELELELLRFASKRRSLSTGAEAASWPRPLEASFQSVLDELENGFRVPLGTMPRRVLIQARVTLEAEMEQSRARFGAPSQDVSDRMTRVFAMIALHMRASAPKEDRARTSHGIALAWPVAPVIVSSTFGYRRDPILGRESVRFHAGVDLAGDSGDLVRCAAPGRVVSASWLGGHGRTVVVQHPGGYQTFYAHLKGIVASVGSAVDIGSPLGFMGSSGRSTGPHLHFELRHGGAPIDPLDAIDMRLAREEAGDSWSERNALAGVSSP
jgi:murein DD-endopeptidase MepM/ murein hydrolase activator NlpD